MGNPLQSKSDRNSVGHKPPQHKIYEVNFAIKVTSKSLKEPATRITLLAVGDDEQSNCAEN
jgi:hypothetical protein